MILDFFSELNWLAVIVATIAWFAFSAIWYSVPPLSKAWQNASKVDMAEDGPPLAVLFIPTLVGYFVTTVVIGLIVEAIGITEVGDGVVLGIVLGIGFGAVSALVTQVYERKGSNYWLINGINAVIAYVIVSVILTVWQ
ncbi:MAG TPA: DUF1761 domain-containing protein [Acidimicrobiia bacterium]|nr:DUF1761 domain-containing protein [Acidimicrobiia bacterium]HEX5671997.1 DUF1761 domain-containing protein [Acidimicrobiia bacterium]